jgi:hypothetical protein
MITAILILAAVLVVVLLVATVHQMTGSLGMFCFHTACGTFNGLWTLLVAILEAIANQNE